MLARGAGRNPRATARLCQDDSLTQPAPRGPTRTTQAPARSLQLGGNRRLILVPCCLGEQLSAAKSALSNRVGPTRAGPISGG